MKNLQRKTIYEAIENDYFDESKLKPPKEFLTEFKAEYNVPILITHEFKKRFTKFLSNMDYFPML